MHSSQRLLPVLLQDERSVTSGEGVPTEWWAAENRLKQLFSKNTGLCETERCRVM